jgi:hypothetical protein
VAELGGELLRVLGRSLAHIQGVAAPEPEALYRFLAAIGTLVVFNDVMVAVRDPPPPPPCLRCLFTVCFLSKRSFHALSIKISRFVFTNVQSPAAHSSSWCRLL